MESVPQTRGWSLKEFHTILELLKGHAADFEP